MKTLSFTKQRDLKPWWTSELVRSLSETSQVYVGTLCFHSIKTANSHLSLRTIVMMAPPLNYLFFSTVRGVIRFGTAKICPSFCIFYSSSLNICNFFSIPPSSSLYFFFISFLSFPSFIYLMCFSTSALASPMKLIFLLSITFPQPFVLVLLYYIPTSFTWMKKGVEKCEPGTCSFFVTSWEHSRRSEKS